MPKPTTKMVQAAANHVKFMGYFNFTQIMNKLDIPYFYAKAIKDYLSNIGMIDSQFNLVEKEIKT